MISMCRINRIILTRPAIEAGEKLGFLPGEMKDKLDPYLQPLYDALQDMIPAVKLKEYMENNVEFEEILCEILLTKYCKM